MPDRHERIAEVEAGAGRLPRDIPPAADLWPGIAAAIGAEADRVANAVRALAPEVQPAHDLWPGIRAGIDAGRAQDVAPRQSLAWARLAAAASLAAVALIASLLALFVSGTAPRPARLADDVPWVTLLEQTPRADAAAARELHELLESLRGEYVAVQGERIAIEAALDRDPSSSMLAALWRHAYAQELALTSKAQEIAGRFERG